MQTLKLIKYPNQQIEEPIDSPHNARAGMHSQNFLIENFQYATGETIKIIALSTQFLNDTGPTCSPINCDTFGEIEKNHSLIVMPLKKSPSPPNADALAMKRKVMIPSAFEVEYACVIEHIIYASGSPEARINILGMDF